MTSCKGYVITIPDSELSNSASDKCIRTWSKHVSRDYPYPTIEKWNACTPDDVNLLTSLLNLKWNYPWQGQVADFNSGLTKSAYKTNNPEAVIACAVSHYQIWKQAAELNESYIVMEHDCVWTKDFDVSIVEESKYNIVGLNSPFKATRRASRFDEIVKQGPKDSIIDVPIIDDIKVPQGLAGNSCYYVNPTGAQALVDAVLYYGLWPNDAIMCRQLIHNMGVTTTYYSSVQGLPSTTTK